MKPKTLNFLVVFVILAISLAACSGPQAQILNRVEALTSAANQLIESKTQPVANVQKPVVEQNTSPALAGSIDDYQAALQAVYEKVNPAVVNIRVVLSPDAAGLNGLPVNPFEGIPGLPQQPGQPDQGNGNPLPQAQGSGFVWDQNGHIVTNNHVVGSAEKIEVTFADGTIVPAELVGTDPYSDLAVIKVVLPDAQIEPIATADSNQAKVGQIAIAIGNPFGLNGTMTVGIISALGRSIAAGEGNSSGPAYSIPNIIQTDAPINPGNSGGVLVDLNGELLGVPTAIESTSGASAGIGFAVPASIVDKVVPALISKGSYEHPYIGIQGTSLTPDMAKAMNLPANTRGALVSQVTSGGPADKAGLIGSTQETTIDGQTVEVGGDVIIAADSQPIKGMDDMIEFLNSQTEVGQGITLTVLRDGQQVDVNVTLAARPAQSSQTEGQQQAPVAPEQPSRTGGWLGIAAVDMAPAIAKAMNLDQSQAGVLVQQVQDGGPAAQAGLRGGTQEVTINNETILLGGDIITAINGQAVDTLAELRATLQGMNPGQEATMTILRDGQAMDLQVILGERPAQ